MRHYILANGLIFELNPDLLDAIRRGDSCTKDVCPPLIASAYAHCRNKVAYSKSGDSFVVVHPNDGITVQNGPGGDDCWLSWGDMKVLVCMGLTDPEEMPVDYADASYDVVSHIVLYNDSIVAIADQCGRAVVVFRSQIDAL